MKEADALLLPSVEEGIANVVLEAMAIGLPVVSSNCGGMSEVIVDGDNGLLVATRDPAHLADCIDELIRLIPRDREHMATKARDTIKKHFVVNIFLEYLTNDI